MIFILILLQNYIWPTDATQLLTSSFSEPRMNRYHTGIDIRTYNKKGFKCFAIDNGYIFRIKTSVYGYGKVVYFKTDAGHIAVFAHLDRFNNILETVIKNKQKSSKDYDVDIYFKKDQYRFNKGDILAYTGSTGVGTPHLHFEIRKDANTTLNPLSFYPNFRDTYNPEVREMAVLALDDKSIVNGKKTIDYLPVKQINDSTYRVEYEIRFFGKIGLSFFAFDRSAKWQLPNGIQKAKVFINDSMIFLTEHNSINFTQNFNSNYDTNLFMRKNHSFKFKNVFYPFDFKTANDNKIMKQGVINSKDLNDNINTFVVEFRDHNNNLARVTGNLRIKELQLIDLNYNKPFKTNHNSIPYLMNSVFIYPNEGESPVLIEENLSTKAHWKMDKSNQIMNEDFIIELPNNALNEDKVVYLINLNDSLFDPAVNAKVAHFLPNDLFSKKQFKITSKHELSKYQSFYEWNVSKKQWDYLSSKQNSDNHSYFTTPSMNIFAIIEDSVPPVIYNRIKKDKYGHLYILVNDDRSGIDDDENFEIIQGNERIVGEYDFETKEIKLDRFFLNNSHTIHIKLKDNAGNLTEKTLSF